MACLLPPFTGFCLAPGDADRPLPSPPPPCPPQVINYQTVKLYLDMGRIPALITYLRRRGLPPAAQAPGQALVYALGGAAVQASGAPPDAG
jgi:hypothetical protein